MWDTWLAACLLCLFVFTSLFTAVYDGFCFVCCCLATLWLDLLLFTIGYRFHCAKRKKKGVKEKHKHKHKHFILHTFRHKVCEKHHAYTRALRKHVYTQARDGGRRAATATGISTKEKPLHSLALSHTHTYNQAGFPKKLIFICDFQSLSAPLIYV